MDQPSKPRLEKFAQTVWIVLFVTSCVFGAIMYYCSWPPALFFPYDLRVSLW
jgi:hypothetical protein